MNNDLPNAILDALLVYWQTDDTKSVAESRDRSIEVIRAVVEPVIAEKERELEKLTQWEEQVAITFKELESSNADLERRLEMARDVAINAANGAHTAWEHPNEFAHCDGICEQWRDALAQLGAPLDSGESGDTLEIARGALLASKKFLLALSARGYEWSDASPMGSAVISHCELALAQLGAPPSPVEGLEQSGDTPL